MKKYVSDLAIAGGKPLFDMPLSVGQINLPHRKRFYTAFHDLFERRYYTNHGPAAQELEEKLCKLFGTRHALTATNATIALSLVCKALNLPLGGKVVVPAFTFAASVQALTWAGLEPVFCDIDPNTHNITEKTVLDVINTPGVCAILGVHLWGNACDIDGLDDIAQQKNIPLFFDAAHAIGCTHQGKPIGGFGVCETFSFHATKILTATEGACVTTNDDEFAERFRNLRSSYGRRKTVSVPLSAYGRFSEAQAVFALLSLEDFPLHCEQNKKRMHLYVERLKDVPGLRFRLPTQGEKHNYQYVVLEVEEKEFGLSRDNLVQILGSEHILARRYFVPGMHRCVPYRYKFPQYVDTLPLTDALCNNVMQLPSGQIITDREINAVCELIHFIHIHNKEINGYLLK